MHQAQNTSWIELHVYRLVDLQPTEILVRVFLPYNQKLEYVKEFKQAHRRDDDIAIANAGMRVLFKQTADGELTLHSGPPHTLLCVADDYCLGLFS